MQCWQAEAKEFEISCGTPSLGFVTRVCELLMADGGVVLVAALDPAHMGPATISGTTPVVVRKANVLAIGGPPHQLETTESSLFFTLSLFSFSLSTFVIFALAALLPLLAPPCPLGRHGHRGKRERCYK